MEKRNVSVSISDMRGNMGTMSSRFTFETVEDLEKSIDAYILEDLELSRVEVMIEDMELVLTETEIEFLEDLNYDVH